MDLNDRMPEKLTRSVMCLSISSQQHTLTIYLPDDALHLFLSQFTQLFATRYVAWLPAR